MKLVRQPTSEADGDTDVPAFGNGCFFNRHQSFQYVIRFELDPRQTSECAYDFFRSTPDQTCNLLNLGEKTRFVMHKILVKQQVKDESDHPFVTVTRP